MIHDIYYITKLVFWITFIVQVSSLKTNTKKRLNNPNDNAFCENQSSAFYVNDNTNVADENASAVIHNITEANCLRLCVDNRDAKGRLIFCASAAYETRSARCMIYRRSGLPDGDLTHKPHTGVRLFEKFCLADDLPADCVGRQFVRVDEYILKGYAQATATFSTLAECAAHCVRETEFQCKSAMYFYEEGECITNSESAITKPEDFMRPDDDDKMIFIHNGCIDHLAGGAPREGVSKSDFVISASEDGASETAEVKIEEKSKKKSINMDEKLEMRLNTTEEVEKSIITTISTTTISSTSPAIPITRASTTTVDPSVEKTTNFPAAADAFKSDGLKLSKLTMKAKIRPIEASESMKLQSHNESAPIAPSFAFPKNEFNENDNQSGALNRLYGARQLEKSADGSFSFQESPSLGEPEHPPSGQIVVEDVIASTHINEQQPSNQADLKAINEGNQKQRRIAHPPGIAPIQTEFVLNASRHGNDDIQISPLANLDAILITSTNIAPRAAMPNILMTKEEKKENVKGDIIITTTATRISSASLSTRTTPIEISVNPETATTQSITASAPPQILKEKIDQQQNQTRFTDIKMAIEEIKKEHINDKENSTRENSKDVGIETFSKIEPTKRLQLKTLKETEEWELFSAWGPWTPCRAPGERRIRRRKCFDLRRCRGALMQIEYCPHELPPSDEDEENKEEIENNTRDGPTGPPVRSPLPVSNSESVSAGSPPSILPPRLPDKTLKPLPDGAPGNPDDIWSPWLSGCQHFASVQPCKNNHTIGFESRECIAKNPSACKGPFFRYCTLPC